MTAPTTERTRLRSDTVSFGLLSALLALSLLLHQLWWDGFEVTSAHAVVVLAATWVLVRPTSVPRFVAMLLAEVVAVGLDMPFVGTHTLLVLIVAGAVVAQLGWATVRARAVPSPPEAFAAIAPFLRVSLIVTYAFAALAKLNTGFLDPVVSCAASMSRQVAWFDPSLLDGTWRVGPAIAGTVAVEAALPVLLAIRRTRLVGVLLGGAFHVVLALAGNVPFTALAFALYVVVLPSDGLRGITPPRPAVRVVVAVVFLVGWVGGHLATAVDPAAVTAGIATGTRVVVVLLALVCGGVLLASRLSADGPPTYPTGSLRVRPPLLVAATVLLVVNGASPYLGLKTDSSFEMFSNLRTEPGAWNHVLIPEAVRIFGYQEPVRVIRASDPSIAGRARVVIFELDRALRARPGSTASYLVDGDPRPRTAGPLPPGATWAERIAVFRDLPEAPVPRC